MLHLIQTAFVVFGLIAVLLTMLSDLRAARPSVFRVLQDYDDAFADRRRTAVPAGFAAISVVFSVRIAPALTEARKPEPAERVLLAA